jgi:hypothetical protein
MKRRRISQTLLAALLASVAAGAALGADTRGGAAPVVFSGFYSITFNLSIAPELPAGTTITCRARIAPNPAGLDLWTPQLSAITVGTGAGLAVVTGSAAACAAEIPFAWTVESARGGAVLSYEIDAVSSAGTLPLLVRSSARQGIGAALPAAGETARLTFNVAF